MEGLIVERGADKGGEGGEGREREGSGRIEGQVGGRGGSESSS